MGFKISQLFQIDTTYPEDVKFIFIANGNIEEIFAHKNVLSKKNEVFKEFFNRACNSTDRIVIDLDKDAFIELLRYIYTGQITLSEFNASTILRLANDYMIPILKNKCKIYLKEHIFAETTLKIYEETIFDDDITKACITYIADHTNEIISSRHFCNIKKDTLSMILKLDIATALECDLFKYVHKWIIKQCENLNLPITKENKRAVIGDSIYLIRFPIMSSAELRLCIELDAELLTKDDIVEIQNFHDHNFKDISKFSSVKRRISQRDTILVEIFIIQPQLMKANDKADVNDIRKSVMHKFVFKNVSDCVLSALHLFYSDNVGPYSVIVNYGDIAQHEKITLFNSKIDLLYPIIVYAFIPCEILLILPEAKFRLSGEIYLCDEKTFKCIESAKTFSHGIVSGIYGKTYTRPH